MFYFFKYQTFHPPTARGRNRYLPGMTSQNTPDGEIQSFIGPCFTIASRAYSEHVGVKRHEGGVNGDMHR